MGLVILPVILNGCSAIEGWRHPELAVCDDYVKATLKAPASFKRAKVTISDSRLPLAYWTEKAADLGPAFRDALKDVNKKESEEGGRRLVLVEYDADNSFGTPLRGLASCTFEMNSTVNSDFTTTPSSSSAKVDILLAASGIRSESSGCCESKTTMARLEKYQPQARYISQQVIN